MCGVYSEVYQAVNVWDIKNRLCMGKSLVFVNGLVHKLLGCSEMSPMLFLRMGIEAYSHIFAIGTVLVRNIPGIS